MSVYLLHFDHPISEAHTTQHYVGWSADLMPRIYAHLHGKGARLTEVAYERGIGFTVARVWMDGDRHFERKIKNRHNSPELCPICRGLALQLPLLAGEPAYVPSCEMEETAEVVMTAHQHVEGWW